ncbi:hypothetical protein [Lactococcus garvieae]|uniref:hypothetical protein n=1 Tax=Lactococcus garvieae TaxID=1363 RepID=UPI0013FE0CEE|nr:hypothetical protein [Lactococcus garvieae]NHI70520.1 hypothetical protein [Lactococcus garvieae]NHJ08318.1 hypothetical protein [Lactococcus garvieae]
MTQTTKKYDYQKENEEKLVDALYQATLKEYPGIPIPDEELAKELLRVGVKAKSGAEELTTLKEHLAPYKDEDIRKIHEEKMQLVTAAEFKAVHRQMLEQTSDLEKKLATAVKALEDINDCTWHSKDRGLVVDTSDKGTVNLFDFTEKVLAEIGGEDDK